MIWAGWDEGCWLVQASGYTVPVLEISSRHQLLAPRYQLRGLVLSSRLSFCVGWSVPRSPHCRCSLNLHGIWPSLASWPCVYIHKERNNSRCQGWLCRGWGETSLWVLDLCYREAHISDMRGRRCYLGLWLLEHRRNHSCPFQRCLGLDTICRVVYHL